MSSSDWLVHTLEQVRRAAEKQRVAKEAVAVGLKFIDNDPNSLVGHALCLGGMLNLGNYSPNDVREHYDFVRGTDLGEWQFLVLTCYLSKLEQEISQSANPGDKLASIDEGIDLIRRWARSHKVELEAKTDVKTVVLMFEWLSKRDLLKPGTAIQGRKAITWLRDGLLAENADDSHDQLLGCPTNLWCKEPELWVKLFDESPQDALNESLIQHAEIHAKKTDASWEKLSVYIEDYYGYRAAKYEEAAEKALQARRHLETIQEQRERRRSVEHAATTPDYRYGTYMGSLKECDAYSYLDRDDDASDLMKKSRWPIDTAKFDRRYKND